MPNKLELSLILVAFLLVMISIAPLFFASCEALQ